MGSMYWVVNGLRLKVGNTKLDNGTLVLNSGSGLNCPSKRRGLCQVVRRDDCDCYAIEAELFRDKVFQYREAQAQYWKTTSAAKIATDLRVFLKNRRNPGRFKALRLNEAGDLWCQECVEKINAVAGEAARWNITTYTYTARRDLDFDHRGRCLVIGSGWEGPDGMAIVIGHDETAPPGFYLCPEKGCGRSCRYCQRAGVHVAFRAHGVTAGTRRKTA